MLFEMSSLQITTKNASIYRSSIVFKVRGKIPIIKYFCSQFLHGGIVEENIDHIW